MSGRDSSSVKEQIADESDVYNNGENLDESLNSRGKRDNGFTDSTEHSIADLDQPRFAGVRKIELLYKQDTSPLFNVAMLFSLFCVGFIYSLDAQMRSTFTGYATESYAQHTALSTVNVVTTVIAAAGQLFYARLMDIYGRLELYILSIVLYVIGTIVQSQATNLARYCVGAIFYQLGYTGIVLIIVIILSDLSSLRWRLFYTLVPAFPFIIITWCYGNIMDSIGPIKHWSWGVGMWAFIFPLANIPFLCCMASLYWRARRTDEWKALPFGLNRRAIRDGGIWKYSVDFFWKTDLGGLILWTVCFGCILVPLTLAGGVKSKWKQGNIIAPIVIGAALIPVSILYEAFISKYPIAPPLFFKNRGIALPLVINILFMVISMTISEYLYTILIVAVNESTVSATRITSLSNFVGVIVGFFYGLVIVYLRRLKPFMIFGILMWFVALGLLFHFRGGTNSHGGIIASECILGFGTGFFSYALAVVIQSHVPHDLLASATALAYALYRVGGAIGSSIGGAIWSQLLYKDILKRTNDSTVALSAYTEPYVFVTKYTWDTPERQAVVQSYRYIQRLLIIVGICLCAPAWICMCLIKDRKLTTDQSLPKEDGKLPDQESPLETLKSKFHLKK